jgi:7-carboxy-7-deazaguanine synthase
MASIQVKEIYRSIQGESSFAGWPCTFVRTTGCDIRCIYCDEVHAFSGGERISLDEVIERVDALGTKLVELTGGEPLLQRAIPELARRLLDSGYELLIETGGHRDASEIDPRVHRIIDVKTPGSGMHEHNCPENMERLQPCDEVKFVLCDRRDYEWARDFVRERGLDTRAPVHFSPVHPGLSPQDLSAWILEDGLRVRLNLQLHKYIWGPDARGV